jgi:hypothetical protein
VNTISRHLVLQESVLYRKSWIPAYQTRFATNNELRFARYDGRLSGIRVRGYCENPQAADQRFGFQHRQVSLMYQRSE